MSIRTKQQETGRTNYILYWKNNIYVLDSLLEIKNILHTSFTEQRFICCERVITNHSYSQQWSDNEAFLDFYKNYLTQYVPETKLYRISEVL